MKPQIILSKLARTEVCVPASMSDAEIEAFVNDRSPLPPPLAWRAISGRAPCGQSAKCVHVALEW